MTDSDRRPRAAPAKTPKVRVIHQTDPFKYFPALAELEADERVQVTGRHRYSVVKEWVRSAIKDRRSFSQRTVFAASDLILRLRLPCIKGEVVVIGCAPWDWRFLLYGLLSARGRNEIVYHTSWPDWTTGYAPRRYGFATPLLRRLWLKVLQQENVQIVTILDESRRQLLSGHGLHATQISHAVPQVFFDAQRARSPREANGPLRLLYVGELSVKKGLPQLLEMADELGDDVLLTIVGDGSLRQECERASSSANIDYRGRISDKKVLATTMADQDLLVLFSQRSGTWQELFGIVLVEAIAAGCGVIATDHVGPRSLLGADAPSHLLEESDRAGLVHLVKKLATGGLDLDAFRHETSHLAAGFSSSAVAEQWWRVIDRAQRRLVGIGG